MDVGDGSVIVITQAFTCSLVTSKSSLLILPNDNGYTDQYFLGSHRNFSLLGQCCCWFTALASNLLEASGGFSFDCVHESPLT